MSVDYPDWTSLRALVNAIAVAGIPLLRGTNGLASSSGVTIPHLGGTQLFSNAIIVQPSFEAYMSASYALGAGTSPFLIAICTWTNSATNTPTDIEQYVFPVGNGPSNPPIVYLSGPCRGDRLSVFISGTDTVADATMKYAFNQTSNLHARDRLYQPSLSPSPPIGFQWPLADPAAGIVAGHQFALAASASASRLLPVWNGRVRVSVDCGTNAGQMSVSFQDPANLYSLSAGFMMEQAIPAGVRAMYETYMPNGPVNLFVHNEDSVNANTATVYIYREEY